MRGSVRESRLYFFFPNNYDQTKNKSKENIDSEEGGRLIVKSER
jgi:hypothetical protein